MENVLVALLMSVCLFSCMQCKKRSPLNAISFDSLISGMNPAEKEIFREELQKEVKKFQIPPSHHKSKTSFTPKRRKLKLKPKPIKIAPSKILPGICDPICGHQCVHGCDFRCCVPGYQVTKRVPRPPPTVVLPGSCSITCSPTCFPECSQSCCAGGRGGMFQSALDLPTLYPSTCTPGCPEICYPFCTSSCCIGQSLPPQAPQYSLPPAPPPVPPPQPVQYTASAPPPPSPPQNIPIFTQCGGSCSQECAPSCLTSCCIEKQQYSQMYMQSAMQAYIQPTEQFQPQPQVITEPQQPTQFQPQMTFFPMSPQYALTCTSPCSSACAPSCTSACCEGKEKQPPRSYVSRPVMQQKRMQLSQFIAPVASQKLQNSSQIETFNFPEAQPMFPDQPKTSQPELSEFPEGLFTKEPSQPSVDISDFKADNSGSFICPLSCPDMCLPDCTKACCNGNKQTSFEIVKKSKIAQQLALLKKRKRRRRFIER